MTRVRKTKKTKVRVVAKATPAKKKSEVTALGQILRTLGGIGGGALGSMIGMPASGSAAGTGLGAAVSRWLGAGDYTVSTNSIVQKASAGIPMMHKEGQSIIVRHREFVRSITPTTAFTVQAVLPVNPGVEETFPWLSGIARQFEQYTVKGMVYHYIPTSGITISGTDSSMGSVMFYTTYRATDRNPTSKAELLNEYWSNESRPDLEMVHPLECNPSENPFNVHYVRAATSVGEQLMYDLGKTFVCTQGQQGTTGILGDIWVTYEVELKKPIVASNVTDGSSVFVGTGAVASYAACFANVVQTAGTMTGLLYLGNQIIFPAGRVGSYIVNVTLTCSTTFTSCTNAWLTPLTLSNCIAYNEFQPFRASVVAATIGCNRLDLSYAVVVSEAHLTATATFTEPVITTGGGTVTCTLNVYHFNNQSGWANTTPVECLNYSKEL